MSTFLDEFGTDIARLLNGGWGSMTGGENGIYFSYSRGTDPIRTAGMKNKEHPARIELFSTFIKNRHNPHVLTLGSINPQGKFILISPNGMEQTSDGYERIFFSDLHELVKYILENMSQGGNVIPPSEQTSVLNIASSWNLGKDTYTREEVIDIMTEMKREMVVSTGQLFDRMLGRLAATKQ